MSFETIVQLYVAHPKAYNNNLLIPVQSSTAGTGSTGALLITDALLDTLIASSYSAVNFTPTSATARGMIQGIDNSLTGFLLSSNNLSDVASPSVSRTNLGLGTMAVENANSVVISGGTIDGTSFGASIAGSIRANSITNTSFATAGIVHNSSVGLFSTSLIIDADVDAAAAIQDTKLSTIVTTGKVANSATTANSANGSSTIVLRDAGGNFTAGLITANLSGNATTATSATTAVTATNFSGSLSGDVTGTQPATTVANGVITNAKIANMISNTFKGNITGGLAPPADLTVAQMKTALGIVGSTTIADTQIGFGNSSNNLIGSSNITWVDSTKVLGLASGSEINLGSSTANRKIVLYDSNAGDLNRFYGLGVAAGQFLLRVDQQSTDFVFVTGLTSTTSQELFRINGNGPVQVGVGTPGAKTCFQTFSTTLGSVALPKMTSTQRLAIVSPDEGSGVYDLTLHQFMGYNGTSWVVLG